MGSWMVCIVFHVCVVSEVAGIELITHPGEALRALVWSNKYVRDPELIPSPDRLWLCKARVA